MASSIKKEDEPVIQQDKTMWWAAVRLSSLATRDEWREQLMAIQDEYGEDFRREVAKRARGLVAKVSGRVDN